MLDHVQAAIVSGVYAPGYVISAPELAEEVGVSVTPVREAMMVLLNEGFVEVVKNKGFRVTAMSLESLDQLSATRQLIEPASVRMLGSDLSEEFLRTLQSLAVSCEHKARSGDLVGYCSSDRAFHALLLGRTHNPLLVDTASTLRARMRLYGVTALHQAGLLVNSAQDHFDLVSMLRRGDLEGAEGLLNRHIGRTRTTVSGSSKRILTEKWRPERHSRVFAA